MKTRNIAGKVKYRKCRAQLEIQTAGEDHHSLAAGADTKRRTDVIILLMMLLGLSDGGDGMRRPFMHIITRQHGYAEDVNGEQGAEDFHRVKIKKGGDKSALKLMSLRNN